MSFRGPRSSLDTPCTLECPNGRRDSCSWLMLVQLGMSLPGLHKTRHWGVKPVKVAESRRKQVRNYLLVGACTGVNPPCDSQHCFGLCGHTCGGSVSQKGFCWKGVFAERSMFWRRFRDFRDSWGFWRASKIGKTSKVWPLSREILENVMSLETPEIVAPTRPWWFPRGCHYVRECSSWPGRVHKGFEFLEDCNLLNLRSPDSLISIFLSNNSIRGQWTQTLPMQ